MAVTTDPTEAGTPIAADFPGAGAAVGSFTTGAAATADFGEADGVTAASKQNKRSETFSQAFQIPDRNQQNKTNRKLFREEIVPGEPAGEIDTTKQKETAISLNQIS